MLVTLALDMAATAVQKSGHAAVLSLHHDFLDCLVKRGILVLPADEKLRERLLEPIEQMPQCFRTQWKTALKRLRITNGPNGWPGIPALNQKGEIDPVAHIIDLLVVSAEAAVGLFGMDEDTPCQTQAGTHYEVCRFDCINMSKRLSQAEQQAQAPIFAENEAVRPVRTRVEDVWKARFEPEVAHSKEIIIVDRYCCEPGAGIGGLHQLLKRVDGCGPPPREVHAYVGFGSQKGRDRSQNRSGEDLYKQVEPVMRELNRNGVSCCVLHCVPDTDFARLAHQRFMRLDSTILEFDVGVALFYGDDLQLRYVYRTTTFSTKYCVDEYRRIERHLHDAQDKYSGEIKAGVHHARL